MAKKLVICPNCESKGELNVLGEVKDNGCISILRFHKGETIVTGDSFSVVCGRCGEEIFMRRKPVIKSLQIIESRTTWQSGQEAQS